MSSAFAVWDYPSLELAELAIHDGVPPDQLRPRAQAIAAQLFSLFPWLRVDPGAEVVEIGPGVAYVMEAFLELTGVRRLTGLDVAPGMIRLAKQRIFRDRLDARRYQFVLYNGAKLPWADGAIDFFYSVATFQHIPKPHAYQLLLEMHRCLSPCGAAVVQFAAWSQLETWQLSFADEVRGQLEGHRRHWHLFYAQDELDALFRWVLRPPRCHLLHTAGNFWAAWTKTVV